MKKILILFLFLFATYVYSDFYEELQKIDILLQQGKFQDAFDKGNKLLNSDISDDDKKLLQSLLGEIKIKLQEVTSGQVNNNNGVIYTTEEGLESASLGTVSLPGDQISSNATFSNYDKLEKEVLKSKNEDNISNLMKIYIKSALYERAMKLGMKSNDVKNIYLSALSARLIGKYDISISQYNRVLKINPNHLDSILGLGLAYRGKKENGLAIKYLTQYLNSGGTNPNVARVIKSLGN